MKGYDLTKELHKELRKVHKIVTPAILHKTWNEKLPTDVIDEIMKFI